MSDSPQLFTVAALAVRNGHAITVNEDLGDQPFDRWHLAADAAHGWKRHMVHKAQDTFLTDADYLAAIEAVKNGTLHGPANKRTETVFTDAEMNARFARDAKKGA